ncbi:MAG: hypothetical protein FWG37_02660 [Clostridia bacterium]|nr:hypothetical protein [Clostridia bacterium]
MRCHHLLCTGIKHGFYKWGSTNVYTEDAAGNPVYDFSLIDEMCDIWLRNNCKPFFEIGFMPCDLADPRLAEDGKKYKSHGQMSEYQRVGWAMPPKDYQRWYDLIYAIVAHCVQRHGAAEVETWYFEMWNEADGYYWRATHEEFCKMNDYTEAAVHAALPTAPFGGPATCGAEMVDSKAGVFLDKYLDHCRNGVNYYTGEVGTRLDFTAFHTKGGGYQFDTLAKKQIPSVRVLVRNVQAMFSIVEKYGYQHLTCVLSEADPDGWAAGGRFDNFNLNFRNTEYYASYTASAYKNLYDYAESIRADIRPLAWAFMFEGERCFEGTRAFSTQGIDKAVFNLLKLYAKLGEQRVALTSGRDIDPMTAKDKNATAEGPEIDGWATVTGDNAVQVLLYCHHDDWDVDRTFDIDFSVGPLPFDGPARITHYRIDASHSNAYAEWQKQGSPNYPTQKQYAAIKARDGLEPYEAQRTVNPTNGMLVHRFPLPTHAISLLLIEKA